VDFVDTYDSWTTSVIVVAQRTDLKSCLAFSNTNEVVMKRGPLVLCIHSLLEFLWHSPLLVVPSRDRLLLEAVFAASARFGEFSSLLRDLLLFAGPLL